MKDILTLLTFPLFLPLFLIAGLIAIVRLLIVILGFAWELGYEWHLYLVGKLSAYFDWLSGKKS